MDHPAEHLPSTSDLETLLRTPGFGNSRVVHDIGAVASRLHTLGGVVGVTVAGPVVMNVVGAHATPAWIGGPLRIGRDEIVVRLNPSRLSSVLLTDPAANVPPTLRLFDSDGNTSHAIYLTDDSDRSAFDSLVAGRPGFDGIASAPASSATDGFDSDTGDRVRATFAIHAGDPGPGRIGPEHTGPDDQVGMFDSILADGGLDRRRALTGGQIRSAVRVDTRRVVAALEHAALLGMSVTVATSARGCMQMRQGRLDGARGHRGQVVLASGRSRVMVNVNHVSDCWVTSSQGAWGPTAAVELYDRDDRCCLVLTSTGPVARTVYDAWEQLAGDLAG
ncbi:ChuX/HutX family heme-like substrate-binding protein [Gordonia paraffinivorans]|uniref:ChuX/HutX family heme-like substrate-binding protein n=1 Tax=Gordonia paraffinivorans TaxID=175628 RepID=UPI001445AB19|nr:ChuX/HutX family heme-like substrate-binding protein [Gordonia paraffinivorans]